MTTRCACEKKKLEKTFVYNMTQKGPPGEFDHHVAVNSAYAYANRICNVYLDSTSGSASVDCMFREADDHELCPSHIFSMQNMSIPHAKHNDPSDYMRDGKIVFPDEDCILRISPDMLKPDVFMNRYLVDYLLFRVNPPEAHFRQCTEPPFNYTLYLKSHTLRVDPPGLELNNDRCTFAEQDRDGVMDLLQNFRVLEITPTTSDFKVSFNMLTFRSLISETSHVNNTSYMSMETCGDKVLYHKMLISQSDLSDIDLIKIRGDKLKGVMDETQRRQFMLTELVQRCWGDSDANISKPLKDVIRWFNSDYSGKLYTYPLHYSNCLLYTSDAADE